MPTEMDAHSHGKGRLMIRQITLWVRVVSAVLGLFLPVYSEAAMGALMQLSGTAGCVSENGTGGSCVAGRGLGGAGWVAVSPDGQQVYVASFYSSAVATLARTARTGVLTQLSGPAGCVADIGDGVTCADGRGLDGAVAIVVSPDGKHVYVGARDANAVAVFARDATTGVLTQLSGLAGCVSDNGTGGRCVDGTGLVGAGGVAVSPDGQHLYVASQDTDNHIEGSSSERYSWIVD